MNNETRQPMTEQRFAQLLASYGADPEHWPGTERAAAQAFMDDNVHVRRLVNEAIQLDRWLHLPAWQPPAFADLETKLLQRALPPRARSLIDRLMTWLMPSPDLPLRQLWRPVVAACLPLAVGLLVGFQVERVPETYSTSVEEELYLISLSDYAEIL
ncbi:MAG: hypothetical protein CMQ34_14565 [Gammaproteobacteria bacterium]|nr:hypothetical protein [Gammaproteobacteria bacterium]|tara:strand:+ start:2038 stop:2508 length:471 start_codon:yes stop_codon:yes gene_type:complete